MSENNLTHFDAAGNAVMVDVSEKPVTAREATAHGIITMNADAFAAVQSGTVKKGDVLGVARVAGIMATKRTSELIPLCHPLPLTKAQIEFDLLPERRAVEARCTVKTSGVTGVEMEALTGVSTALLTIYDMCKAVGDDIAHVARFHAHVDDIRHQKRHQQLQNGLCQLEQRPQHKLCAVAFQIRPKGLHSVSPFLRAAGTSPQPPRCAGT